MVAHILIIDDQAVSRGLLHYLLSHRGYAVSDAEDGKQGLQMALGRRPDLILCDLQMPLINGYEVAQQLLSDPSWKRVPLIAITAASMPGDRELALSAGFDDHLSKPIDPRTLVAQVETYLPRRLLSGQ